MEALMGSSSSSPFLKLVSCRDNKIGFLFLNSSLHHSPNKHNHNNKHVDFKLLIPVSSTRTTVRPVPLSSSHTQAEVENRELLIEESTNGHTIKAETEIEKETKTETVRVKFMLKRECSFGQNFLIAGDDQTLGLWDPNNAIPLTWSDGHLWTVDLDIPIEKCIKFKFIMQEINGEFVWQPGPDRVLECFKTEKIINLCEDWEDPDLRQLIETDPTMDQEIQMVAANEEMAVEPLSNVNGTEEPNGYAINMNQMLVPDEGVPVLVPGLSQYQDGSVKEDEPEPVNGAAMLSARADMAKDLNLPEVNA